MSIILKTAGFLKQVRWSSQLSDMSQFISYFFSRSIIDLKPFGCDMKHGNDYFGLFGILVGGEGRLRARNNNQKVT